MYQASDLSVLAYANNFTLWHYTSTDKAGVIAASDYFKNAIDMLRVNDLIIVNADTSGTPVTDFYIVTKNTGKAVTVSPYGNSTPAPATTSAITVASGVGSSLVKPAKTEDRVTHELKSWTMFFEDIVKGVRTSDIRSTTDRRFKVGDHIVLKEFDAVTHKFTGRTAKVEVTYIQTNKSNPCAISHLALADDYAVLSIAKVAA